jgi:hypothetical protein
VTPYANVKANDTIEDIRVQLRSNGIDVRKVERVTLQDDKLLKHHINKSADVYIRGQRQGQWRKW